MSLKAKFEMYEGVVIPSIIHGSGTWVLNVYGRRKIEVFEKHV